ncbi:MAG: hypothetical protein JSV23_11220 [Promethearchaeota archaeon]|nr:MAG: hypothetical protein JSV23_11220 [Candidatus Lokiarchaeota archaeon]
MYIAKISLPRARDSSSFPLFTFDTLTTLNPHVVVFTAAFTKVSPNESSSGYLLNCSRNFFVASGALWLGKIAVVKVYILPPLLLFFFKYHWILRQTTNNFLI